MTKEVIGRKGRGDRFIHQSASYPEENKFNSGTIFLSAHGPVISVEGQRLCEAESIVKDSHHWHLKRFGTRTSELELTGLGPGGLT